MTKRVSRRLGSLLLLASASLGLVACGGAGRGDREESVGQLALPLTTQGASGVTYRLRNATFAVHRYTGYYYDQPGSPATSSGGSGSLGGGGEQVFTVSSEDDPAAQSISLSLEEGDYYVELMPGWSFEKDGSNGPEFVEATLISGETQWVWVSRLSTSWAEYQFGLGGRELWLNGQLNIQIVLHEDPKDIYGTGGSPTSGGAFTGGASSGGAFTGGASSGGGYPHEPGPGAGPFNAGSAAY